MNMIGIILLIALILTSVYTLPAIIYGWRVIGLLSMNLVIALAVAIVVLLIIDYFKRKKKS